MFFPVPSQVRSLKKACLKVKPKSEGCAAGYGRIEPRTTGGRLFCVLFGLSGIPIVTVILANLGKYLHEAVPKLRRILKRIATERVQRRSSLLNAESDKKQVKFY
jgi:hypothetical protein